MKILLLEPFMGESHQAWAEGYARHSRHHVEVMGLPGRHWKWRMHGAAETFAKRFEKLDELPDLILATDMLDLAGFLAHTRRRTAMIPVALYCHENQLAYPWSPTDPDKPLERDRHYGYINYRSALVADAVFWNSAYNMESFLGALDDFLSKFPDHQELQNVEAIRSKSRELHLGIEFPQGNSAPKSTSDAPPLVLWNHRWEYDKGPQRFFETLFELAEEGIAFRLAVVGRAYQAAPPIFAEAQKRLKTQITHWGFLANSSDYHALLQQADILPVTATQDFFGISVVEAMHAGCLPLLPNALAYPMHIPQAYRADLLYDTQAEFYIKLRNLLLGHHPEGANPAEWVRQYDWRTQAPHYDDVFEALVQTVRG